MYTAIKAYFQTLAPSITEEEWENAESRLEIIQLKKGAFLFKEGQVCQHVAFINKGLIRAYNLIDGKEFVQGFVPQGEFISEYTSFLTRAPATLNMDAMEDSELILLHYDDLQELYNTNAVYERVGRKIAEYLFIEFNRNNIAINTLSPEQRYQLIIENEAYLLTSVPQYMIASYLGITPEHLSRIRKKMAGKA
jgi:CRP/FNR family transcriptional regulator, anaerobic regulatory protein